MIGPGEIDFVISRGEGLGVIRGRCPGKKAFVLILLFAIIALSCYVVYRIAYVVHRIADNG